MSVNSLLSSSQGNEAQPSRDNSTSGSNRSHRLFRLAALGGALWLSQAGGLAAELNGATNRFVAASRRLGEQLATSFDAGDAYQTPTGPRRLRRLAGAVAVQSDASKKSNRAEHSPNSPGESLASYVSEATADKSITIYSAPRLEKVRQLRNPAVSATVLNRARQSATAKSANPVFVDPTTGLRLLATESLVLRLKPGVNAPTYFGATWKNVQPVWGTTDQFILTLPGATAEQVFAEVDRRARHPQAEWVEPDLISEVVKSFTPNDPYFSSRQWHLNNTGQSGGTPGADARLPAAWDSTNGNANIVIAIIDDGVQIAHPDLAANIFQNGNEIPGNGRDDDLNGLADDVRGWDFLRSDPDPSPESVDDNHGNAVSGVAAAVGNNGVGVAGAAYGCRLLPIKIISSDFSVSSSGMARAVRYAAGLGSTGLPIWRGADILNLSLVFSSGLITESAFQDAATKGRGGKGCPIFVAAGNSAAAWQLFDFKVTNAGTYTFRWEYSKDESDVLSIGADTAWLDSISWPDGTHETFEAGVIPAGWTTSPAAPWTVVSDGVNGNHAVLGWGGPGSRSLRAGRISHRQTSYVETTRSLTPGTVRFWFWVESERQFDFFSFQVNGVEETYESGVPILSTQVDYPANLPQAIAVGASTDFDYRADYSQYGPKLDFVAPSDGGVSAIYTTDRTGTAGYNDGQTQDANYTPDFGGTSSSAPLASGIAALILSMNPYLTAAEVRALMRETCDRTGNVTYNAAGRNIFYGSGRLNAARAVQNTKADLNVTISASPDPVTQGDLSVYTISVMNNGPARSGPLALSVELPVTATFSSATPAPATRNGNVLGFTGATLASGSTTLFRVTVTNSLSGTNFVIASVGSEIPEDNLADNLTSTSTSVLPAPVLTVSDPQALEGSGTTGGRLVFNIALDRPSSRAVSATYTTVTNTAGRTDFKAVSGTVTLQPGQLSAQIFVDTLPDALDENDEIMLLKLGNPSGAILGNTQAIGTILDDDASPSLLISGPVVREGNSGTRLVTLTAKLSAASGRTVTVDLLTRSITAEAGSDFIATNGVLRFPPGNTLQRFAVGIIGDTIFEGTESFEVALSNPANATLSQLQYTVSILDNELPPKISVNDTSVVESDVDGTNALFTLRLSAPSAVTATVRFSTTNGSAVGGIDFAETNGVLSFPPGETNLTLSIPVLGDVLSESNEFFSVRLSNPLNASLADVLGRATILDNDPLPTLAISDAAVSENPTGVTNVLFLVELNVASGRTITVRYATVGSTAISGPDFAARSGSLSFPPGTISRSITVPVNRDTSAEPDETFLVNLSSPVNATLLDAQAIGTILAPALSPPALASITEARVSNGRFQLRFTTQAGARYAVECSHSLDPSAVWMALPGAENVAGTGEIVEVSDPEPAGQAKCFYRVRSLP